MSPAKRNITLQVGFVRTELETGHRMLALAGRQRRLHEDEAAMESLSMARMALSGAQDHLIAVNLPRSETKGIVREIRELRRQTAAFEADAGPRRCAAKHTGRTKASVTGSRKS